MKEQHYHLCQECDHIWQHEPAPKRHEAEAHKCPVCKSGPYYEKFETLAQVEAERGYFRGELQKEARYFK